MADEDEDDDKGELMISTAIMTIHDDDDDDDGNVDADGCLKFALTCVCKCVCVSPCVSVSRIKCNIMMIFFNKMPMCANVCFLALTNHFARQFSREMVCDLKERPEDAT